jgi:hypothetical protein
MFCMIIVCVIVRCLAGGGITESDSVTKAILLLANLAALKCDVCAIMRICVNGTRNSLEWVWPSSFACLENSRVSLIWFARVCINLCERGHNSRDCKCARIHQLVVLPPFPFFTQSYLDIIELFI